MNRFLLLLLILFPLTDFFEPPYNETNIPVLDFILKSIGSFCFLCWVYAIGMKANARLRSNGIEMKLFRIFRVTFIVIILTYVSMNIFTPRVFAVYNGVQIHYHEPLALSLFLMAIFFLPILIAAKALVSAERKEEAGVMDSFGTFLQMLFAPFGLWWIQPRVKNI